MPCPVCEGESRPHLQLGEFLIARCGQCSHQFCNAAPTPDHVSREYSDDYFLGGGSGYPDYLANGQLVTRHAQRYARLLQNYCRTDGSTAPQLLDVGCAAGFVMRGFAQSGWQVTGIDPNRAMVDHAGQQLGLTAHQGTLESISSIDGLKIPTSGFDLVVMVQVVAHFHQLRAALANLPALLRPGGLILVETWDSNSLMARALGRHWHEYNPPNVLHNFTRASLDCALEPLGLKRIAAGRPGKRIGAAHLRSALRHKYGEQGLGRVLQSITALVPARMALPYPAEDLFWHLYRL